MAMFRLPPSLLAGISFAALSGAIASPRDTMARQKRKLADKAGEHAEMKRERSHNTRWWRRQPKHRANYHTAEHRAYRAKVVATHTGGDHTSDPRDDKYLNSYARGMRVYARAHATNV